MRPSLRLCLAATALTAAACSTTTRAGTAPAKTTTSHPGPATTTTTATGAPGSATALPADPRTAALALGRAVLRRVPLPPGTTPTAAPSKWLTGPPQAEGTPDQIDTALNATTSMAPSAALAYFSTHPPAGLAVTMDGTGSVTGPHQPTLAYRIAYIAGLAPWVDTATISDSVIESAVPGRTDLRVDVQITWLPPKPPGVTVPIGDTVAVVSVTETHAPQPGLSLPAPKQVTVTDPDVVRRLRAAADGLPAAYPAPINCPLQVGTLYRVAFAPVAGSAPNLTFSTAGCPGVWVTRADGSTADLGLDAAFQSAYDDVLGLPRP